MAVPLSFCCPFLQPEVEVAASERSKILCQVIEIKQQKLTCKSVVAVEPLLSGVGGARM